MSKRRSIDFFTFGKNRKIHDCFVCKTVNPCKRTKKRVYKLDGRFRSFLQVDNVSLFTTRTAHPKDTKYSTSNHRFDLGAQLFWGIPAGKKSVFRVNVPVPVITPVTTSCSGQASRPHFNCFLCPPITQSSLFTVHCRVLRPEF